MVEEEGVEIFMASGILAVVLHRSLQECDGAGSMVTWVLHLRLHCIRMSKSWTVVLMDWADVWGFVLFFVDQVSS